MNQCYIRDVQCPCVKKNQSARALYQSLGFSIVKEKKYIKMVKDLKMIEG